MLPQPDWNTIKKKLHFQLNYSSLYVTWFLRWLIFGAITGVVCGLAGAAFLAVSYTHLTLPTIYSV